jgi:putative transposase
LLNAWQAADAWLVGRYVIMPDHVHLFAGPMDESVELDVWIRYWKSMFTRAFRNPSFKWQSNHWDTRMRGASQYQAKWEYVKLNPIRHGLVEAEDQWPYQGEIHEL